MKYRVENDLTLFEFHDSEFHFADYDGENLTVTVAMMNIHTDAKENPFEYDMQIKSAKITFKGFRDLTFEPGRPWEMGEDGVSRPVGPQIVYSGKEAEDIFLSELQLGVTVYDFYKFDDGLYYIDGFGTEPFFTVKFDFDSVIVEWDDYAKKAWYEYHKQYKNELVLDTPDGEQTVEVTIHVHENENDSLGESWQEVIVGVKYSGKEYWGHGKDYLWIDAFADLQKQLPDGVSLKCCLSCRYGNMCPVGNAPNELFCTKDLLIEKKSDLNFCAEDETEREKRSRRYTSVCEDYQPQSEEYFTYNDYPFFLKDTP